MQVIAIRFNREGLGEEAYETLKTKLANAIKQAFEGQRDNRALSLEIDNGNNKEQVFLLGLNTTDKINPDKLRNSFLVRINEDNSELNNGVLSSLPDLAGTNPFDVIPDNGESHEIHAVRLLGQRLRPKAVGIKEDRIWAGGNNHGGIRELSDKEVFILNLAGKQKTWMAVLNKSTPAEIVSTIYKGEVGKAVLEEQGKINPNNINSGWKEVSNIARALPNEEMPGAIDSVKITASHLAI